MPLNVFTAILLMHFIAIVFLATQTDNNNHQKSPIYKEP